MRNESAVGPGWRGARALLFALAFGQARPLHAEPEGTSSAREHFEAGYRFVEQGALDAAIEEFEQAYEKSPHFSVLYNLGQAYASLGKSAEAVDRLERYLELGGTQLTRARVEQVRELIAYHSRRVGRVQLEVRPPGARVSLDGKALPATASSGSVPLTLGLHGLVAEHPGYATRSLGVRVVAGETTRVSLALDALPPVAIGVTCAIPDVITSVDGKPVVPTQGELLLTPGDHQLGFRRAGYLPREQTVRAEARGRYDCALSPDPSDEAVGTLRVRHPRGTIALLDGAPFSDRPVPAGRHRVSIAGEGVAPATRMVTVVPNATQTVELMLGPATLRQREQARTRKLVGLTVGGVGAAAVLAAGALYLYNTEKYADFQQDSAELLARFHADPTSVSTGEMGALFDEQNRIYNRDAIALGVGVFGVVSLAAATALLLWPSAPTDVLTVTGSGSTARFAF